MREQGVALEDQTQVAAVRRFPGDVAPVHQDLSLSGIDEAGDDVEQGGLAAAGGAQHGEELPGLDVQGVEVEDRGVPVAGLQVADGDVASAHAKISFQSSCSPFSWGRTVG
ncbi:Uncharacterised protein [Mycobacteroides abscessus subsp. abscessus]|nr:Uncharacterised protein [Mycobacteroides abscessus subsp. abscessus]